MALAFTRANSDMLISNAAFAHNIGTGDFTVMGWITLTTATGFGACFSTHRNEPWANALAICPEGVGSSNWGIIIGGSFINFGTNLTTGTTYHLAVTRSGTTVTGYVNGVSDGTGTSSYNIPNNTVSFGGCSPDNNYHDGLMEDWAVCAAAIPAAKLLGLVTARKRAGALIYAYSPRGYWPLDRPGDETDHDYADGDFGGRDLIGKYHLILHTSPATAPVWTADFVDLHWPASVVMAEPPAGGGGAPTIEPGLGEGTWTGFAPTVQTPVTVHPGLGEGTWTGFAPTVPLIVNAGLGQGTWTGFAPTVNIPATVAPGVGAGTWTGFAPTIDIPATVSPGLGEGTWTGFAPTVTTTVGAVVDVGLGEAEWEGFAPDVFSAQLAGGLYHHRTSIYAALQPQLEVYMRATAGNVYAMLWDLTAGAMVAGSFLSTASTSLTRLESGDLALVDGHDYRVRLGHGSGDGGEVVDANLVFEAP